MYAPVMFSGCLYAAPGFGALLSVARSVVTILVSLSHVRQCLAALTLSFNVVGAVPALTLVLVELNISELVQRLVPEFWGVVFLCHQMASFSSE